MTAIDWTRAHEALRPAILRIARSVLRDQHEAEDAVQDTFLRAIVSVHSLRDPAAFGGWVLVVARRAALDRLQRVRRAPQVAEDLTRVLDHRHPGPSDAMEAAEAYARLSPRLRRVLDLKASGQSIAQIARLEGISISAAKTRLSRARARIRALVEP